MQKKCQRLAVLLVFAVGVLGVLPTHVHAASPQISGDASYDTVGGVCVPSPPGYPDFTNPLVMRGSLAGCWYTKIETSKQTPSGVYLETGEEVFVGTLNGGPAGTFATTYKFESKWDPNVTTGIELSGHCQHDIVTGTGGFTGVTGQVFFKDDAPEYFYRGNIHLG